MENLILVEQPLLADHCLNFPSEIEIQKLFNCKANGVLYLVPGRFCNLEQVLDTRMKAKMGLFKSVDNTLRYRLSFYFHFHSHLFK